MHLLEFIYTFFRETGRAPGPEEIYRFSHHHFFWATIVAFVLVCLVIILLSPNFSEVRRSLSEISLTRRAVLLLSVPTILTFCAAVLLVNFVHNSLEPVPVFKTGQRDFVRQPVVLAWDPPPEDANQNATVIFKVQRAAEKDIDFRTPYSKPDTDGNALYDFEQGTHRWRVQPWADGHPLTHGWSKPVQTSFYWTAYNRIIATKRLRVYVSSSANQGIFKFLNNKGELSGADIAIARRIAQALEKRLPPEQKGGATILAPSPIPIAWGELLNQPRDGKADIIISSISKSDTRESEHSLKFSMPYFCTGQSVLFRRDEAPPGKSVREYLRGKVVGYQERTTSELLVDELLKETKGRNGEPFFTKKSFSEAAALVEALQDRNSPVQAILTDTPFALDAALSASGARPLESQELSDTEDYPSSMPALARLERYAVGVAQGETELLKVIDDLIADLAKNGELETILQKAAKTKFPDLDSQQTSRLFASKPCPDENKVEASLTPPASSSGIPQPSSVRAGLPPRPVTQRRPPPASASRSH
jgi:ABC-type amino acid transport substrate-binding protein